MPISDSEYPKVEDGKGVVVFKRKTAALLIKLMRRGRARAGANCSEQVTDSGTFIHAQPGGSIVPPKPFQLIDATDRTDPENPVYKIRVKYSTVDGVAPTGFSLGDNPIYTKNVGVLTSGKVYAEVTKDTVTGDTTTRTIEIGATMPASDAGAGIFRGEIGSFDITDQVLTVANAGYGPVSLCRNWFSNPANYTLAFTQYS